MLPVYGFISVWLLVCNLKHLANMSFFLSIEMKDLKDCQCVTLREQPYMYYFLSFFLYFNLILIILSSIHHFILLFI